MFICLKKRETISSLLNSNLPLFRPLRLFKSSNTYKLYGNKLSYTRCREVFKNCLKDLGLDYNLYGLHSLRSRSYIRC